MKTARFIHKAFRTVALLALAANLAACSTLLNATDKLHVYDGNGKSLGEYQAWRVIQTQMLVDKAIQDSKAEGFNNYIEDVNVNKRTLLRDNYIFIIDPSEVMLVANPYSTNLVGLTRDKATPGLVQILEYIVSSADADGAWVTYKWSNPETGELDDKVSWVILKDGYVFGSGLYVD